MMNLRLRLPVCLSFVLAAGLGLVAALAADDAVQSTTTSEPAQHYRAKQLLGLRVNLDGNTAVGTIDDIILDSYGNVDYVIVVNDEKKLVTVPWDAIAVQQKQVTVHITPDRYKTIPTYTTTQYPTWTPAYRSEVYRYYGLTPGQSRRMFQRSNNR